MGIGHWALGIGHWKPDNIFPYPPTPTELFLKIENDLLFSYLFLLNRNKKSVLTATIL